MIRYCILLFLKTNQLLFKEKSALFFTMLLWTECLCLPTPQITYVEILTPKVVGVRDEALGSDLVRTVEP